jgi:hypothetical protein
MNYLSMAAGNPGTGGYAFSYADSSSTVCLDGCPASPAVCSGTGTALCGHGSLPANPAPYPVYGGIGINLNQALATSAASPPNVPMAVTGTGITYALSSLPTNGVRLAIDDGATSAGPGTAYCAVLTAASGTVPWASFNTKCYDVPPDGTALTGPPQTASQIEFQMVPIPAAAVVDDFCVTAVSF